MSIGSVTAKILTYDGESFAPSCVGWVGDASLELELLDEVSIRWRRRQQIHGLVLRLAGAEW
jgi:hypothetical protein